jgi:opacity protein-like surface antigen
MKKMFLTMALALVTMLSSAQFMVVSNLTQPADDEQWGVSNLTDNIGIGYQLNDKITIGTVRNGEDYDLWGRYKINFMYVSIQAPTDSTATDNMSIGIGYSLRAWNNLYIEPNYSMPMRDNDGGTFKLGVAYRF